MNCELVDLTGISLDDLRHTTDESVAASVRTVLRDVSDPLHRTARMNSSGSDCSGSVLPDRVDERGPVPLITC
ncbi:hypothetical protein BBK82_00315 [Lentzea guizhouensis]|uniref:FXSXX-COOH protein n=1 Tax=Lentzea guizhouensis TaxID=1586287 RepID=A0A1B2HAL2_9PSEU|nr:hypothetical protein BBK82_00315 [Lentzea guizhouensis]